MDKLRNSSIKALAGISIDFSEDFQSSIHLKNGIKSNIILPKADVIKYTLENETVVAVRPSGTEPKIKFYYNTVGKSENECIKQIEQLKKEMLDLIK
jgi:phosphoglucomutase